MYDDLRKSTIIEENYPPLRRKTVSAIQSIIKNNVPSFLYLTQHA